MTDDTDDIVSRGAELARKVLADIDEGMRTQPVRLAQARARADDERIKALAAEPWADVVTGLPTVSRDGDLTGMLPMPTMVGKEVFGTRLAFDLLAHCDNEERVSEIMNDAFAMIREPGHIYDHSRQRGQSPLGQARADDLAGNGSSQRQPLASALNQISNLGHQRPFTPMVSMHRWHACGCSESNGSGR
jgi:hypothetical protein